MNIYGSEENLDRWYADHEKERAQTERPGDTMTYTHMSYDGFGINDTNEYRSRLATFHAGVPEHRRKEIGALWIAAPAMLEALKDCLTSDESTGIRMRDPEKLIRRLHVINDRIAETIRLAEGRG